ncbi:MULTISPECIES: hypothetical protein [Pseudomonas]|jgi:hypothetical protein|nr:MULTISPECIES: hypothetical protein [Pseudomonas]
MSLKNDLNDVLHDIFEGQKGEKGTDLFKKIGVRPRLVHQCILVV